MPWQLVPKLDDRQAVSVDKAILFFGRHPECDVVITSSRKVSRKHCCLAQVDGKLVVRDLGSMNGIRLNGRMVDREATLKLGDLLIIGDVEFHISEAPTKPRRESATPTPSQKRPRPADLSLDVPVVIAEDESRDSAPTSRQKKKSERAESSIILNPSDIIDDRGEDSWLDLPETSED